MPDNVQKKYRLRPGKYDEVSLVDAGANQHAHVVLMKRDSGVEKATAPAGGSGGGTTLRAQNWNPGRHPRVSAGNPAGGEFAATSGASKQKYGKGGTTAAKLKSEKKSSGSKTSGSKTTHHKTGHHHTGHHHTGHHKTKATAGGHYKVVKGDTLWALAQKYYGDGTKWKEIARANGVKDPRKLQIGTNLKIPHLGAKASSGAHHRKTTPKKHAAKHHHHRKKTAKQPTTNSVQNKYKNRMSRSEAYARAAKLLATWLAQNSATL